MSEYKRVKVFCEGKTEQKFMGFIAESFNGLPVTGIDFRGDLNYERIKNLIIKAIKNDKNAYYTTFFNLYALKNKFPNYSEAKEITCPIKRCLYLEQSFKKDIEEELGYNLGDKFFPHIQPYEFEALLFSDIGKIKEIEDKDLYFPFSDLCRVDEEGERYHPRDSNGNKIKPEFINNTRETSPSHRIIDIAEQCWSYRKYNKPFHGIKMIKKIGLEKIREECKHFNSWYDKLSKLTN